MLGGRRQEDVPEAFGPRLRLQLVKDGGDLPPVRTEGLHLRVVDGNGRIKVLVHETQDAIAPMLLAFGEREIHGLPLSFLVERIDGRKATSAAGRALSDKMVAGS